MLEVVGRVGKGYLIGIRGGTAWQCPRRGLGGYLSIHCR